MLEAVCILQAIIMILVYLLGVYVAYYLYLESYKDDPRPEITNIKEHCKARALFSWLAVGYILFTK
jgi:hypothetical protein